MIKSADYQAIAMLSYNISLKPLNDDLSQIRHMYNAILTVEDTDIISNNSISFLIPVHQCP